MKILEYIEQGNRVIVSVLYPDGTFSTLNMLNTNDKESILRDVYIISSDARNRQPFEGKIPVGLETYHKPQSSPSFLRNVDFYNLTGKVYDQYGSEMEVEIQFSIENTDKVRIENGKIVEDVVDTDTTYFIVAKVGELEQRQERTIYAPVVKEERPDLQAEIEALKREIDILTGVTE